MEEELEDIYSSEGMEDAIESDEIDDIEEGFMHGYEDDHIANCAHCGKVLIGPDEVIEEEIDGKVYRFCSLRCADKFNLEEIDEN